MAGQKFVDLATTEVLPAALERVPEPIARREHILPLTFDGERLTVVMSEPPSSETLERLRFALNYPVTAALAPPEAIRDAIDQYYGSTEARKVTLQAPPVAEQVEFVEIPDETPTERQMLDPGSPAVVRMTQEIIGEALHLTASRVLILPIQNRLKVAYRIQDAVCTRDDIPRDMHYPILVRLMTMTNLSGLIKVHVGEREFPLRAVFKPSQFGLLALIEVGGERAGPEHWQVRAKRLGYPYLNLDAHQPPAWVLALVPESIVRHRRVLPVGVADHVLTVAMSDPPEPDLLDQLRFLTNRSIEVALTSAGSLLAAIDRHYGPADSEAADLILWELAQVAEPPFEAGDAAPAVRAKPTPAAKQTAQALFDHLHTLFSEKMFKLFGNIRAGPKLCRRGSGSQELEVVFPQSHLIEQLPPDARAYIENRVWALREAVIVRLESFLAANGPARGLAMSYALYLAGRALQEGRRPALSPAAERDAWINFLYALAIRFFPAVQSNGALLALVAEQMDQVAARLARLLEDTSFVSDPGASQPWLMRLTAQSPSDEPLDSSSPPVAHLVDLLLSEAVHVRASRLAIVPQDDRLEVAYRVQKALYARDSLPLELLYPVLDRLCARAEPSGALRITGGSAPWDCRLALSAAPCGPAASVELLPRGGAVKASRALAARHRLEFVELADLDAPPELLRMVPMPVLRSKMALPLGREEGGVLKVAVGRPPSPRQLDALRLSFNSQVRVALAAEDDLSAALYRHSRPPADPAPLSPAARVLLSGGPEAAHNSKP